MPRLRTVTLLLIGNALFFWQLRNPIVRFASPVVNQLLGFALGFCLPWLLGVAIFRVGRRWSKVVGALAIIPLLLYSAVFLLGSAMTAFAFKNGRDLCVDQFAETRWKGSVVRLYRTNGGATTDFGVVIRQERSLLPGVELVRNLALFYPCEVLNAVSTDRGIAITDERSECRSFRDTRREYRLKPSISNLLVLKSVDILTFRIMRLALATHWNGRGLVL